MINGYKYIMRESADHKPVIAGTRLTISRIVRDVDFGRDLSGIEDILDNWGERVSREMIDEVAFYDALEVNDSAVKILGDDALRKIALELTDMIRNSVTIDWTQRESVQAGMRLKVKKILRKYGYPPDKEKYAIETVLKQAELIVKGWISK